MRLAARAQSKWSGTLEVPRLLLVMCGEDQGERGGKRRELMQLQGSSGTLAGPSRGIRTTHQLCFFVRVILLITSSCSWAAYHSY